MHRWNFAYFQTIFNFVQSQCRFCFSVVFVLPDITRSQNSSMFKQSCIVMWYHQDIIFIWEEIELLNWDRSYSCLIPALLRFNLRQTFSYTIFLKSMEELIKAYFHYPVRCSTPKYPSPKYRRPKYPISQNTRCPKIPNVPKNPMSQNTQCPKIPNVPKYPWPKHQRLK